VPDGVGRRQWDVPTLQEILKNITTMNETFDLSIAGFYEFLLAIFREETLKSKYAANDNWEFRVDRIPGLRTITALIILRENEAIRVIRGKIIEAGNQNTD
jgi:hypothetical protein